MRILLLTGEFDPFRGGIGTYARELAIAASESGHQVTVVAPDYNGTKLDDRRYPFRILRFRGGVSTMRGLPSRVLLVRRLAAKQKFEIVHAVDWPFFLPLALSRFRLSCRCMLTFHGTEIRYMQHAKRRLLLSVVNFWSGWSEYIANSRYTKELLLEAFTAISSEQVRAIPLGVSRGWLEGRRDRSVAREQLGISEEEFVILSVGRLVPRKGHLVLAAALELISIDIAQHMRWIIVGSSVDESYATELRKQAASLPVSTVLAGSLSDSDMKSTMSAADVFCLPGYEDKGGRVEGFGLVFLEAGAYGVPSIATTSGGVPDAIDHECTGLLVPPHDPHAVAEALLRLFRDAQLRSAMADAAVRKAEASTWAEVARATYAPTA